MESSIKQLLAFIIAALILTAGGFLLLKYFYPQTAMKTAEVELPEEFEEVIKDVDPESLSEISTRGNIVLSDIKNVTYKLEAAVEAKFSEGKFEAGIAGSSNYVLSKIESYSFGDVNLDGNGDAVVVTSTQTAAGKKTELHAVLNDSGLPKVIPLSVKVDNNIRLVSYKKVEIREGKVNLIMDLFTAEDQDCCPSISRREVYRFEKNELVPDKDEIAWKEYHNSEFKFGLKYPEDSRIEVRPIYDGVADVPDSLRVNLSLPFITSYNTWTKKTFTVYSLKGACHFRNAAAVYNKGEMEFRLYDPPHNETSNTEAVSKLRELMIYRDGYCYTIVMKIEGPGPKSADFPKEQDAIFPENLENFLKLEMASLEQVLDTFILD